ncbi:MAG: glutaredoxin family protein [Sulfuricella sp.]|nr:glutaredoxin family protein [Sulfuricella sp.]
MKLAVFFCLFCMFAVYSAQSATLYRWVDADGKVHFTDQPPPPAAAKQLEERTIGTRPADDAQQPYATRLAAKNFPVVLYNANCGEACTKAREHLAKRGVPFTEKDAGTPEANAELKKLVGSATVPVLAVGKVTQLKGYETGAWDAALDDAGYPKYAASPVKSRPTPPPTGGAPKQAPGGVQ